MQEQFRNAYVPFQGSSTFDRSHEVKMSFKMGANVPNLLEETLPGDIFRLNSEYATRFAPLESPMMHRVNLYSWSFFVPLRLIWKNFKYWITGTEVPQDNGSTLPAYEPTIKINSSNWELFKKGTLADYLGIPVPEEEPAPGVELEISALPFRAYQIIYNEYFRNQYLEPDLKGLTYTDLDTVSPSELAGMTKLQFKWWEKDYFTSAFLQPQMGEPVNLPVDIDLANLRLEFDRTARTQIHATQGTDYSADLRVITAQAPNSLTYNGLEVKNDNLNGDYISIDNSENLRIAGATASPGTIADLQYCRFLQSFLNISQLGGSRYPETIKAHFGVTSSDARLQRPEFLGGGKTPVKIGEVIQNSESTEESPLGSYAGRAVAFGADHGFKSKFIEEHGLILTIECIFPRSSYQQGIERLWTRRDRLDYYWPSFANLQEQAVLNKEIYVNWKNQTTESGAPYKNDDVFGYQARFMEYRVKNSRVAGDFRDILSYWHMGRIFDSPPSLDMVFGSTRDSQDTFLRPFAYRKNDYDYIYQQVYHNLKVIRRMPKYAIPKF